VSRCNKAGDNRGFTLVELQIAIVIMAMISLLLLGALRLTSQTWGSVTARQDAAEKQFLLSQVLRRHLSAAHFVTIKLSSGEQVDSFFGGRDYLHYVAPFPRFINDGALYWWTLKIVWDENYQQQVLVLDYQAFDRALELSWDGDSSITSEGEVSQRLVLAADIDTLTLAYFGDSDGQGPTWRQEWLAEEGSAPTAPQLLRLQMVPLESGVYQAWPAMVLALGHAVDVLGSDAVAAEELAF